MAADYAGAVAAIKQRFVAQWVTDAAPTTPIAFVNEAAPSLVNVADGNPVPWVMFEVVSSSSTNMGSGVPGSQVIAYDGMVKAHVFVSTGSGDGTTDAGAMPLALAAGEIFRNKVFFDDVTPGCYVRTLTPRIDEGDVTSNDGKWFAVTATIPFEYWHRG